MTFYENDFTELPSSGIENCSSTCPILFMQKALQSWKNRGSKTLIIATIALFSYQITPCDVTNILVDMHRFLASSVNDRLLNYSVSGIERMKISEVHNNDTTAELRGTRSFGTALELCLHKLTCLVRSAEDIERESQSIAKDRSMETYLSSTQQDPDRSALYGTCSLMTFKEERDGILGLLGIHDERGMTNIT